MFKIIIFGSSFLLLVFWLSKAMSRLFGALSQLTTVSKWTTTIPHQSSSRNLDQNLDQNLDSSKILPSKLPSHMNFRACESTTTVGEQQQRPLLLLFAWMASQERHIEKFRQMWFERNFDVLTIRTSLYDLMVPEKGTRKNSEDLFNVLSQLRHRYPTMLFHSISVGNFHSFDFIYRTMDLIQDNDNVDLTTKMAAQQILRSIKGYVVDSIAFPKDFPHGLGLTFSPNNRLGQLLISTTVGTFLKSSSAVVKRFEQLESHFTVNNDKPTLCLFSDADVISDANGIRQVVDRWRGNGAPLQVKCWEKSPHVMHFREYPEEYAAEVDTFLSKLEF